MKSIKGESYKFSFIENIYESETDAFVIEPINRLLVFPVLFFVEDLDLLFVAVSQAIEKRENKKNKEKRKW